MQKVSDKKPRWGTLVGSKSNLAGILTGKADTEEQSDILADDLLFGAKAIAAYTGLTVAQVYHLQTTLGLVRLRRRVQEPA
jgi:hypothetical protein